MATFSPDRDHGAGFDAKNTRALHNRPCTAKASKCRVPTDSIASVQSRPSSVQSLGFARNYSVNGPTADSTTFLAYCPRSGKPPLDVHSMAHKVQDLQGCVLTTMWGALTSFCFELNLPGGASAIPSFRCHAIRGSHPGRGRAAQPETILG